ncbi:ATP-binding protein [Pseudomonas sp. MH10]|uniref:ATP-binding protein n=1 Tax=Pseudomonas sp. MH10 TaxID=3048627 RepID=UPI003A100012
MAQQAAEKETSYADFLEQLLLTEQWSRLERRRQARLNFSGLPAVKTLSNTITRFICAADLTQYFSRVVQRENY